ERRCELRTGHRPKQRLSGQSPRTTGPRSARKGAPSVSRSAPLGAVRPFARMEGVPKLSPHLRRILYGLVFVLVVEYLVVPQLGGARRAAGLLAGVKFRYIFAGIGLEALSILSYARLTRSILPRSHAPSLWT